MFEPNRCSGPEPNTVKLEVNRECLLFVLDRYFHPQVVCANPGGCCERIEDTIRFLTRNLEREERLMDLSGFTDAQAHKQDHERVLRHLDKMMRTLVCSRYDNTQVAEFLETWADDHALAFDKPFGDFLRTHGKGVN